MERSKLQLTFSASGKETDILLPSTIKSKRDLARLFVLTKINNYPNNIYSTTEFNNLKYPPSPIDMSKYNSFTHKPMKPN